jgi:hypothetical protein
MADSAAHLVDRVLPEVPVRQWVLTLPYPLRYRCAWNARLTSEVLRCFLRAVFADYRRRAKRDLGVKGAACGSVTFIQRFGSALNLTPHFHTLVLDGVYEGGTSAPGRFRALDPPETDDVARVLAGTARRIRRRLEILGVEEGEDRLAEDEPLLAMLTAASIRSRIATGPEAGAPWRRLGDRVDPDADGEEEDGVEPGARIPPRCVRHGGMSLHADVAVPARDRRRLERLEETHDGRLAFPQRRPRRRRNFPSRCRARTSSSFASSRARQRSRTASSSGLGGWTSVRSPPSSSSASLRASRRSVLIRSPGLRGISDGAITWQSRP